MEKFPAFMYKLICKITKGIQSDDPESRTWIMTVAAAFLFLVLIVGIAWIFHMLLPYGAVIKWALPAVITLDAVGYILRGHKKNWESDCF